MRRVMKGGVRVRVMGRSKVQGRIRVRRRLRRWVFRKEGVGWLANNLVVVGGWCLDRLLRLPDGGVVLHGSFIKYQSQEMSFDIGVRSVFESIKQ